MGPQQQAQSECEQDAASFPQHKFQGRASLGQTGARGTPRGSLTAAGAQLCPCTGVEQVEREGPWPCGLSTAASRESWPGTSEHRPGLQ